MFSDLLAALKALMGGVNWLRQLHEQDRKKFAAICDRIAQILKEYIDASGERRQAIALCARLRENVVPIRKVAGDALPPAEIDRVAGALENVCNAWQSVDHAGSVHAHVDAADLDQIHETMGMFQGLADTLRAA